jgi:flagellar basal-body rod modification protein FlgD
MSVTSVDNHYRVIPETTSTTSGTGVLDSEQFLKLLVTQLEYQDPMNPISDMDYSAQLAQFSELEQSIATSKNVKALYTESAIAQAASLIGKQVYSVDPDTSETTTGVVRGVALDDGVPMLLLNDGTSVSLFTVEGIVPGSES